MLLSSIITPIGEGLMTTWTVNTPFSHWVGYQALTGMGIGMGQQQPQVAIQTVLPRAYRIARPNNERRHFHRRRPSCTSEQTPPESSSNISQHWLRCIPHLYRGCDPTAIYSTPSRPAGSFGSLQWRLDSSIYSRSGYVVPYCDWEPLDRMEEHQER
jgi:hypothetical protein